MTQRPSWVPENQDPHFTTSVQKGVDNPAALASQTEKPRRRELSVDELAEGVQGGDRARLARAITLIESNAERHFAQAQELVQRLNPESGKSIRIGITGVPGVGKSTFIEAFGYQLCEEGHRVAVLAVDPSSSVTGGAILGDKTRMEKLATHPNAYIRPSPSKGTLGGLARKSRETVTICEAAGYDIILLETVGVGQSEVTVRSMTDFFLLLALAGAGDELQGIKKGVVEMADAVVINKADGDNLPNARGAMAEFARVLHYLRPITEGWTAQARMASGLTGEGLPEIWEMVQDFRQNTTESGAFERRRRKQQREWFRQMLEEEWLRRLYGQSGMGERLAEIEVAIDQGKTTVPQAVAALLSASGDSSR